MVLPFLSILWLRRIMETFSQMALVTPHNQRGLLRQVSLFLRYQTITLCCKDCEAVFKKDPCKFCKDEKCEKRKAEDKH